MSQPGILLMAAGLSRRYRAQCGRHKLHEILPGTSLTLFEYTFNIACASGLPVHAVLRPEAGHFASAVAAREMGYSALESGGLGESIAAGVRATAHWPGWVVMLADMPALRPETLVAVSNALVHSPAARPCWRGQPGHPVGFSAECRHALQTLSGDEGARALLRRWPARMIAVSDRGCIEDIDIPQQLCLLQHGE